MILSAWSIIAVVPLLLLAAPADARSWFLPATGAAREGEATFQAGDKLDGPPASHSPQFKMLRPVFRPTAVDEQIMCSALDRCTYRHDGFANGMIHHLIALDNGGSGMAECPASLDQSDIAA